MTLLELTPTEQVIYDPATGYGYLLTRAPRRRGPRSYDAVMQDLERLEREWSRDLTSFLEDEAEAVAARVRSSSRRLSRYFRPRGEESADVEFRRDSLGDLLTRLFDKVAFRKRMKARVDGLYGTVIPVVIGDVEATVGASFDVKPSQATQRMLTSRANQLAGHVSDSVYKQLKRVLLRGIQEGDAIPDLASRVQDTLKHASRHRAAVIARTEVVSAYNGGVHSVGNDLPQDVVVGQQWIATQDSRTRPAHRTADGQVVARGDTFTVGGEELRYPGDPAGRPGNIINCRCALRLLTPLDVEDGVVIPPSKRALGPYLEVRTAEDTLLRVALGRVSFTDAVIELRGEKAGHKFHGNQWQGKGEIVEVKDYGQTWHVPKQFVSSEGDIDFTGWQKHEQANTEALRDSLTKAAAVPQGDEGRLLSSYQSAFGVYHEVNGKLRDGDESMPHVKALDSLLERSPLPHDLTVHRGVQFESVKAQREFMKNVTEGATVADRGYTSTSLSESVASQFTAFGKRPAVVLHYDVPKGTGHRYMGDAEDEVLLPRNMKAVVKSVKPGVSASKYDVWDVHLEVTP